MGRILLLGAALGIAAAALAGGAASAGKLIPGGWLQPIELPKPPPRVVAPAADPPPLVEHHRRERIRVRRPAPHRAAPPAADGHVRF
jgi:hypothetical protein